MFYNDLYCSPVCALRLVYENNYDGYSKHIFYKDINFNLNDCSQDQINKYIYNQENNNERYYVNILANVCTILGVFFVIKNAIHLMITKTSNIKFILMHLVYILLSSFFAKIILTHTHFSTDVNILTGGIIHHAIDEKFGVTNNSVTEGFLLNSFFNRILYCYIIYSIISKNDGLNKILSYIPLIGFTQIFLFVMVERVKEMHPIYHEMTKNGVSSNIVNALPYTHEWRAYKHCVIHHNNGLSFSGDLFLDPIYDFYLYLYSYVHNNIITIPVGSPMHYIVSICSEVFTTLIGVVLIYIFIYIAKMILKYFNKKND